MKRYRISRQRLCSCCWAYVAFILIGQATGTIVTARPNLPPSTDMAVMAITAAARVFRVHQTALRFIYFPRDRSRRVIAFLLSEPHQEEEALTPGELGECLRKAKQLE